MFRSLLFAALFCTTLGLRAQKFDGLAATPPMGWNSWNTFATNINEQLVRGIADTLVSSGMRDAGYVYLVLDDAWMAKERDENGNLVPDPLKFPSGMKAIADYVHSKGLKFGLYNCAGTQTCGGYPGTRGYEYQDARLYASWGVDYLKYDWCNTEGLTAKEAYTTMSKALRKAGRPMVFSLCEWGGNQPWEWATPVGHLWRTTGDIYPCFDCIHDHGTWKSLGVMAIFDLQKPLRAYAGPGHWNDPDMMEVGKGMRVNEDRAHFSLWAMLAAPLIAGNDLRSMSAETRAILTNRQVIGIDQDSLGIPAFMYASKDSVETWIRPLHDSCWAVCFFNRGQRAQNVEFDWKAQVIEDPLTHLTLDARKISYGIIDVWDSRHFIISTNKPLKITLPGHDVVMFRLYDRSKF